MSAKSYTKVHFGGNIRIVPLFQNKSYSLERVLYPFARVRSIYRAWGNVENILRQTFYEMVIVILPLVAILGDFCVVL